MTDPKKVIALLASDQDGEVVAAARALIRMAAAANLPITEFLITRDAKAADTMQRFAWKPNPRAAEPRTYVPLWKKLYEAIMAVEKQNADKINSWEKLFLASIHDASFLSTKQMAALQRIADKIGVKV